MAEGIVKVKSLGERTRALVRRESPDGSGRLDLIVPEVNSRTNVVTWKHWEKCAHGVEYVLLDEDDSNLNAAETAHFNQGSTTGEVTQDVSTGQETSQPAPEPTEQPQETWQRLGFASKAEWKDAGKPQG